MDPAKALKPSLCLELEAIHANDMMGDDLLGEAAMVTGEDFSIDDLLDFSNEQLQEEEKDSLSVSSTDSADDDSNSNAASFLGNGEDSDLILGSELAVPVEDIAEELEWLSQFVDDSFPSSPSYLILQPEPTSSTVHPSMPVSLNRPCFPSPFPVKIRSKRSRIPQPISLSPSTCETSSTSSWSSSPPTVVDFLKTKKSLTRAVAFQRRCSHCLVQRTPQWRTGPLGPKTLCNACGVRYKSGRLFPEYRPACSPTFAVEIHSNSHRKVLEMRRKKESGLVTIVSSC